MSHLQNHLIHFLLELKAVMSYMMCGARLPWGRLLTWLVSECDWGRGWRPVPGPCPHTAHCQPTKLIRGRAQHISLGTTDILLLDVSPRIDYM